MRLYKIDYKDCPALPVDSGVRRKKIGLLHLFIEGERKSLKTLLGRLYFYLISKGSFSIYYTLDPERGTVTHSSYVTGASYKFPFMHKGDIHIGPCRTAPEHRGKGLYKQVLRAVLQDQQGSDHAAYMLVAEDNLPSIRGIEACGFRHEGSVEKHSPLKIYRRVPHDPMEKI